jgi:hypothetical protein
MYERFIKISKGTGMKAEYFHEFVEKKCDNSCPDEGFCETDDQMADGCYIEYLEAELKKRDEEIEILKDTIKTLKRKEPF